MSSITGNGTGHIYYNITLTNNDTNETGYFPPVSFTETRNTPFLNCPQDYFMSVVRFSLETPTLPVMIAQPVINDADVNLLAYAVTITYTPPAGSIVTSTYNLEFVPPNNLEKPPVLPLAPFDVQNSYYNLYSYNSFVLMVNTALEKAYTAAYTGVAIPGAFAPYLAWDSGGNLAILNVAQNLKNPTYGNITISFNTALYTLFSSFPSYFYKNPNTGIVYHELIVDTGPSAIIASSIVGTTTVYYYSIIQEYTTCPLWTPIDSIVFTTSMIPINPELVAAPVVYNNNNVFTSVGGNANLTTVLTDFIVPLVSGTEYKPSINYTPQAEYRLVSMFGTNPINSIQVNVYYKNRFGTLIPLTLGFGCSASIKIMFRRKDFSNIFLEDA